LPIERVGPVSIEPCDDPAVTTLGESVVHVSLAALEESHVSLAALEPVANSIFWNVKATCSRSCVVPAALGAGPFMSKRIDEIVALVSVIV
jgi:hypothetical protein